VEPAALRALLAGVDPVTGEVLSAGHDKVRVVAYDCTYSTPKSVSVLHALGPENLQTEIRAGHEEAALAALGYLERQAARVRRREGRGEPQVSVASGGFAAAAFVHRTSRAPDPHLHSHVLVANLSPGPDGRWSALDGRGLYLELASARDLYETQLRHELTSRLGVSWRELHGAWSDIVGVDAKLNKAFSRRSAEINAALEHSGRDGARASRIAAARTRPEKDLGTPYETLVSDWRERSYRLGVSDNRLASVAGREALDPARVPLERWAEEALGQNGVVSKDGTCRRGELIRSRCASLRLGAPVAEVEQDVDSLISKGRIVALATGASPRLKAVSGRPIPPGVREVTYTTPAVKALHARLEALVRARPGAVQLLSYAPGERLASLDELARLGSGSLAPVTAVAPGQTAAASFEAVTGIETSPVGRLRAENAPPEANGAHDAVLVLAEAQRLGPWEMASALAHSLDKGMTVVVFAPSAALEARFGTASVLAPHLAAFAPTRGSFSPGLDANRGDDAVRDKAPSGVDRTERHFFAGREVLAVGDGPAARAALFTTWQDERALGREATIFASDDAVLRALREDVEAAGGSREQVIETRRLKSVLAPQPRGHDAEGGIIVLGALPAGLVPPRGKVRAQVVIVSPRLASTERLAKAAEVARPGYLVSELGPVPADHFDRAVWREGASVIESFRRRWSIDDGVQALGDARTLRSGDLKAFGDAAETRAKLRQAIGPIDRSAVSLRRALGAPDRSR
jgi:conjugative relaxase-like TrwC/TraI family protein